MLLERNWDEKCHRAPKGKKLCIEEITLILSDGQNSTHAEDNEAAPPHAYTA